MSLAYDKLATQARELLSIKPRPATEDVAYAMLLELAEEFEVAESRRAEFAERLLPAIVTLVSTARAKLVREIEEEAVRPYLARPLPSAESPANRVAEPNLAAPAFALGDGQRSNEAQTTTAVPVPEPMASAEAEPTAFSPSAPEREGDLPVVEAQMNHVALPAPQVDGHDAGETHDSGAVPAERGDEAARYPAEPRPTAPPVTPLSLRAEVLDGWRPLRDELLFVPEYEGVTYGTATAEQRQRAMTYYHSMAGGFMAKSRRMRVLDDAIRAAGAATLNEMLDGRALVGRES